jgi:hypothetical protein
MSAKRVDMLGGLIPRKGTGRASVEPPEIELPMQAKRAGQGRASQPVVQPEPQPNPTDDRPSRILAMSFRLSEDDLLRLKTLALRTGRSQQQVLYDAMQRELAEHGY